jgi:hypothetical protein
MEANLWYQITWAVFGRDYTGLKICILWLRYFWPTVYIDKLVLLLLQFLLQSL